MIKNVIISVSGFVSRSRRLGLVKRILAAPVHTLPRLKVLGKLQT